MFFQQNETSKETVDTPTQTKPRAWEKTEEQKLIDFRDEARRTFLNDWLNAEGDWLSTMNKDHLDFLRDLLGIDKSDNFTN
jgi:hypothetical protein